MSSKSDMKLVKIEAYSINSAYKIPNSSHCLVVSEDKKSCWSNHGRGWDSPSEKTKVAENQAYWEWLNTFVPTGSIDKCGISFGINGLCHNYAARELLVGRDETDVSKAPKNYVCVFFFGKYGMGLDDLKNLLKTSYYNTMASYYDPYNALNEVLNRVDNTVDFELKAWRQVALDYVDIPVDDIMAKNPKGGIATARSRMRSFINKRENVYRQNKSSSGLEKLICDLIQTESDDYLNMLTQIKYISEKDRNKYSENIRSFLSGFANYVLAQREAYISTGQIPDSIILENFIGG